MLLPLILSCGGGTWCDEGTVRSGDDCIAYEAGDPVPSGSAWQPGPGTTWQWQLSDEIDTTLDVQMYDIDLFDVPDSTMEALHDDGRTVVCYFSAGSFEDWRDDAADFPEEAIGDELDGWEGEAWLDVMNEGVRAVMEARLDLAVERGCDGVEPDNVDGYDNDNGIGLNATEQLAYNRWIADQAHNRGLSVGLKNDMGQLHELSDWFDWALNEECATYDECDLYADWTGGGKSAFHVEYVDDWADAADLADEVCGVGPDLDTLVKEWDLTAKVIACN